MTSISVPDIIAHLKKAGHRITVARKEILTLLLSSDMPLSALEVYAKLQRKHLTTTKGTVYRELAFLSEQGILDEVQFTDGILRYEYGADGHRHHLICTGCKRIQNVEMAHDMDAVERRIKKQKRFTVTSHSLEFYGRCATCK